MNKKGAVGLPLTLLVTIIVSLVILAGGIKLLVNFIELGEKTKIELDQKIENQIQNLLLVQGKKVALPGNTANIIRGESGIFGLGILNIDETQLGNKFSFNIILSDAFDESEKSFDEEIKLATKNWLLYHPGPHHIEENSHHSEPISIIVPKEAKKGTYIFDVQAFAGSNTYDHIKKITVIVK